MSGVVVLREFKRHFCCDKCRKSMLPCDLCLAQRRHMSTQRLLAAGKPTLAHRPFAALAGPTADKGKEG